MDKESITTRSALGGGAVTTGLVLVTGCLGSKALVLLGISTGALGALSDIAPYRPLLLVAGLAAVAFGAWRIYRSRTTPAVTPHGA